MAATSGSAATLSVNGALRYRPTSAIDAVCDWIVARRIPWWLVFVAAFALVGLAINGVRWVEGTNPFPTLDRFTLDGFYPAVALVAYGLITRAAGRAMFRFEQSLAEPAERIALSRRRLTRIPLWQSLVAFGVGSAFGIITVLTEPAYLAVIATSTPMLVVTALFSALGYGTAIVVVWQLVRIVAEVTSLHRRASDVSLDRPGPSHAFATVTAGGGIFLVAIVSYSALTDPATFANVALIGLFVAVSLIAALVFVLPLLGMRARIIEAKRDALDALGARMEAAVGNLEAALDAGRYEDAEPIRSAVGALADRQDRIRKASTWPWDARVASGFATTVIIPILIWLVTTYAGRLIGL